MKQTTLEDLYYGNINPNEISFVRGSEYGKCFDKVTELSKSVCSQLTEEYQKPTFGDEKMTTGRAYISMVGKNILHCRI